jgi:hypothetical protein
MQRAIVLEP